MTRLLLIFIALFGISLIPTPVLQPVPKAAFAQSPAQQSHDFQEAMDAFQAKKYATARHLLENLSNQGYAPAQYNLGLMYARGLGMRTNFIEAYKWFKLAEDGGEFKGQIAISRIRPKMSQSDFAKAVELYDRFKRDAGR